MAMKSREGRVASSNGNIPPTHVETAKKQEGLTYLSIAEIKQLIALMNATDLTEISIDRPASDLHLVLRHTTAPAHVTVTQPGAGVEQHAVPPAAEVIPTSPTAWVTAPLVGIYQVSMKANQTPLVAVGDFVREGQIVAGIESLNVMNEVESSVAGRITKILAHPGQRIEYGQPLIEIAPEER